MLQLPARWDARAHSRPPHQNSRRRLVSARVVDSSPAPADLPRRAVQRVAVTPRPPTRRPVSSDAAGTRLGARAGPPLPLSGPSLPPRSQAPAPDAAEPELWAVRRS